MLTIRPHSSLGAFNSNLTIITTCLAILVSGCQNEPAPRKVNQTNSAAHADKLVEVVLGLNWYPEAEHGGFYAAVVHGYFADEGLKVTIRPGGPKAPVLADVASGTIDFGVDNADKLLLARVQQADNVAVMAPIQNSPRCIMVHKNSGLTRLEDLKDKRPFTLAINSGQPFAKFLGARVDLTGIQIVPYAGKLQPFLEDPSLGIQAYNFSEPFVAEREKSDPLCLMMSDLGFNPYTSTLVTRRDMISKSPDIVRKMVRASIRGWQKYLSEPEETNKHIHGENEEMALATLEFGVAALKPLCLPEGFDASRIGEMTSDRWTTLIEQMTEIGLVPSGSMTAADVYTAEFLTGSEKQNEPDKSPAR